MLKQRLITVGVVLPLLLALLFFAPNPVWAILIAVPIAAGAFEWARLAGFSATGRVMYVSFVALSCAILLIWSRQVPQATFDTMVLYPMCFAATAFWALLVPASLRFHWNFGHSIVNAGFGWLVLVPTWLAATALQRAPFLLFLILAGVWVADTAAYFSGRRFGKHKLSPRISPGKTIEGLVGAYFAVSIYVVIALRIYSPDADLPLYSAVLVFGFVLTSLSVIGDLFESWFKRRAGAKDSGDLLPGHGGILDRIDSITATIPFAVLFFGGILA